MTRGAWRGGLAALVVVLMTAVTACARSDPDAGGGTPLRVAMFASGSALPVHVALTRDIFDKHGLDVEITEGQDLPVFTAALANGQYDIAMSGPSLVLIAAEKNLDLQIVASMQRSSREKPNAVWITADPGISSLPELRGHSVGVPSLTGTIVDAVTYLMKRDGVPRADVDFVHTPFPTMGDQLAAGNVDAVVASIPFASSIRARGYRVHDDVVVEAVRDASEGTVDAAMTVAWASTRGYAEQHPTVLTAWRAALDEAIAYLREDDARARTLMHEWLKIPMAVLDLAPLPDWTTEVSPADLAPFVTISRDVGVIDSDPDVARLVWQPR